MEDRQIVQLYWDRDEQAIAVTAEKYESYCMTIAKNILRFAKSVGSLIFSTICTCVFMNLASGEQYLSLLITGKMFQEEYEKRGVAPQNLSRALEDGGTLTSPLIPWCTCAVAMSTYLGVSTLD